jgi:AmpD protein
MSAARPPKPRAGLPFDAAGWCERARRRPSPHCDVRPAGALIDLLVIHHISLPAGCFHGDAIERLFTDQLDPAAHPSFATLVGLRVSAHFLIRRRGELLQFVLPDQRAWHAGVSVFQGRPACNDFSVGIELEGTGERPYTTAQYRVLAALTRGLVQRWPLRFVAGHSDIAPGRKTDPGPSFDWARYLADIADLGLMRDEALFAAASPVKSTA